MKMIFSTVATMGLLAAVVTANGATFTVINNNDSGTGSLRDAITQANASPAPNTVNFDPAVTGSIILTTGQIRIAGPMAIVGPGADKLTIDGNANNRIFTVAVTSPACPALDNGGVDYLVSISGLRLTNARRGSSASGGAIWSEHSLAMDAVIVDNSVAAQGAGLGFATQYPGQTLTISNSQFLGNLARPVQVVPSTHWGGGLFAIDKCGTYTTPVTVTIANSLFSGNRAQPAGARGRGGAIGLYGRADVTISDTRIVDNHVDVPNPPVAGKNYFGGGIVGQAKSLTIVRSEISDNSIIDMTATGAAGGGGVDVFNDDETLQAPESKMLVTVVNSTISGNASSANAGAMDVYGNVAVEFDNSTVSNNVAAANQVGGIRLYTGTTYPNGTSNAATPSLKLVSAIVANSSAGTSDIGAHSSIPSLSIDASNSLVQTLCSTCSLSGSGNLPGLGPLLGPLNFNGGPTRTHALLAGSPAINTGSNPLALTTDQRGTGFARVVRGAADMGAYEFKAADLTPILMLLLD